MVIIVPEMTFTESLNLTNNGITVERLREGETYFVNWDGVEYKCVCKFYVSGSYSYFYLGDIYSFLDGRVGDTATGEPFTHYNVVRDNALKAQNLGAIDGGTHTISVYQKTETEPEEPTAPIPVGSAPDIEPRSFMAGLRTGQIVRAMRKVKREPIAYSYNGVVLPGLPEWDKTVYPYAVIVYYPDNNQAVLFVFDSEGYYEDDYDGGGTGSKLWEVISVPKDSYYCQYQYTTTENFEPKYVDRENKTGKLVINSTGAGQYLLWSNYNVMDESGGLYLAASDPIPVYE